MGVLILDLVRVVLRRLRKSFSQPPPWRTTRSRTTFSTSTVEDYTTTVEVVYTSFSLLVRRTTRVSPSSSELLVELLLVLVVRVLLHGGGELDLGGFSVSALGVDNSNKNWGT